MDRWVGVNIKMRPKAESTTGEMEVIAEDPAPGGKTVVLAVCEDKHLGFAFAQGWIAGVKMLGAHEGPFPPGAVPDGPIDIKKAN